MESMKLLLAAVGYICNQMLLHLLLTKIDIQRLQIVRFTVTSAVATVINSAPLTTAPGGEVTADVFTSAFQ